MSEKELIERLNMVIEAQKQVIDAYILILNLQSHPPKLKIVGGKA